MLGLFLWQAPLLSPVGETTGLVQKSPGRILQTQQDRISNPCVYLVSLLEIPIHIGTFQPIFGPGKSVHWKLLRLYVRSGPFVPTTIHTARVQMAIVYSPDPT